MPARTGAQYLAGLRARRTEVWLRGERVTDVTTHPGLAGGARAIASLYDLQSDPALREADDLYQPGYRGHPGTVVHHPPHARRSGAAARDDAALGSHDLRHDGALARLHERDVRLLGRFGRLFRPRQAGIRRQHAALLSLYRRTRPRADPRADQPAAQPQRQRNVQPAGRHRTAGGEGNLRRHRRPRRPCIGDTRSAGR